MNVHKILRLCTSFDKFEDDLLHIVNAMPRFTRYMVKYGEIPDEAYHSWCPKLPVPERPKDGLVMNRRRAIILTNRAWIDEENCKAEFQKNLEFQKQQKPKRKYTRKRKPVATVDPQVPSSSNSSSSSSSSTTELPAKRLKLVVSRSVINDVTSAVNE